MSYFRRPEHVGTHYMNILKISISDISSTSELQDSVPRKTTGMRARLVVRGHGERRQKSSGSRFRPPEHAGTPYERSVEVR